MVKTERLSFAERIVAFVVAHTPKHSYPAWRRGKPENCAHRWLDWAAKFQAGGGSEAERRREAHDIMTHAEGVCDALVQTTDDDSEDVVLARATLRHDVARLVWFSLMGCGETDAYGGAERRKQEVFKAISECRRLKAFWEI